MTLLVCLQKSTQCLNSKAKKKILSNMGFLQQKQSSSSLKEKKDETNKYILSFCTEI